MMANELLVYTVATGRYTVFSDLWSYCIKHEYPEYVSVISGASPEYFFPGTYAGACIRYLILPPRDKFDYYYITDADMFIVRETTTLIDFHLTRMKLNDNEVFSNSIRGPGEPMGASRVTGLHFCTNKWFELTKEARKCEYDKLVRGEIGHYAIDDELMLSRIITESGLKIPPRRDLLKAHHGIHLGTVRGRRHKDQQELNIAMRHRITRVRAERWCGIVDSKDYPKLYVEIKRQDEDAAWQLDQVTRFSRQRCNEKK